MLKNYFRIAWRNITRHKGYTGIHVLGLALGICACIVIFLITNFELGFDKFHPDKERIFRIVGEVQSPTGEQEFLNSVIKDVAGFQHQITGFESKAGAYTMGFDISIPDGKNQPRQFDGQIPGSYASTVIVTWPEYFDIFKYQWLQGSAASLREPFKVVLSENRARKYFGNIPLRQMMGKTVVYDDSLKLSVSGIVRDWTENTDFGYTDFISVSTATHSFLRNQIATDDWTSLRPHASMTFVKLQRGTTPREINDRFTTFIRNHVKFGRPGTKLNMYLQPLSDVHFTKEYRRGDDGDDFRKAHMPTLYALMGIALFILVIATCNFINLSTAQSIQRAKEIGVRKVLGGSKTNITGQFLIETFVLTAIAVIVSVLLVNPMLHLFHDYLPDAVTFSLLNPSTLLFLIAVTIITTILAGFYPARVLASYLPVFSLKGSSFQKGTGKLNLRKTLIIFQFTVSMIFIIAVIIMGKQMNFMKNADKGFNTDAIITINNWGDHSGKMNIFASDIRHLNGVDKVLYQGNSPMGFAQMSSTFTFKGKKDIQVQATLESGDETYIPFYQMRLIAGRNMVHSDSLTELVINETMAKAIGFDNPHDAVGKLFYSTGRLGLKTYPIVGVVADFHQGSFHDGIQPAIIGNTTELKHSVAIKLTGSEKNTKEIKSILSAVEEQWKKIFPEKNFDYSFLNESIGWLYGQEEKTAWLVNVAMGITIFISCMGLFGLAMFNTKRRIKEIGIRKVLGASVSRIAFLLSKDFVALVIIAFVFASPLAYYFAHEWLGDYAYRTDISWWVFAAAGTGAVVIALGTISYQAIKAARANPVESLRTE